MAVFTQHHGKLSAFHCYFKLEIAIGAKDLYFRDFFLSSIILFHKNN